MNVRLYACVQNVVCNSHASSAMYCTALRHVPVLLSTALPHYARRCNDALHARMYVHSYVRMCLCTYVRMYVCMYVCMCLNMAQERRIPRSRMAFSSSPRLAASLGPHVRLRETLHCKLIYDIYIYDIYIYKYIYIYYSLDIYI